MAHPARFGRAVGLIACDGQVTPVDLPSPFLVFDAVAWSQSLITWYEDAAQSADEDSDGDSATNFRATADEIKQWLVEQKSIVRAAPLLAVRQAIQPLSVTSENWRSYLNFLLKESSVPLAQSSPQFVLHDGDGKIELLAVKELRAQVSYTGEFVRGRIVSQNDIEKMIADLILLPVNS